MAEVWPWVPLDAFEERLSWLTAVHPRRDDTSRWSLRSARQVLVYDFAFEGPEWEDARALYVSNALGTWHVPCWSEATRGLAVDTSDTTLAVSTQAEYAIGGLAIIWSGCESWTVVTVSDIAPGLITLSGAVGTSYASALVMPLRACIVRGGLETERRGRNLYRCRAAFEATDNPDVTQLIEPLQVQIALDVSGSMATEVATGLSRLDVAKSNVAAILFYLEQTGLSHDVRVVGWDNAASSLERLGCDAADYADLRAFVDAFEPGTGTDFSQAFDGASAFFTGSVRRVFLFVSDGEATSGITAAIAARDAISDLETYTFNIALSDTSDADLISSSGETQVVAQGGVALRDGIVLAILGLAASQAELFLECGGAVIGPQSGRIRQAATYVDSGFGPVEVEEERSFVEETGEITMAETTVAARWRMKQQMHFLSGQDRPFRVAEKVLTLVAATATTATVAPVRGDVASWVGLEIEIDGFFRTVTAAAIVSGNHRVSFASLGLTPSGPLRVLRRQRLLSDQVVLEHNRRGGRTRTRLLAGTP